MHSLRDRFRLLLRHETWLSAGFVLVAYLLLNLGWRDAGLAMAVFLLSAPLMAAAWAPLRILWRSAFAVDLGIKAFLISVYRTKPDTVLILDSVSNSNWDEAREFLTHQGHEIALYGLIAAGFLAGLLTLNALAGRRPSRRAWVAVASTLVFAALHLNPTFRSANPFCYWPTQIATVDGFQDLRQRLVDKRNLARAKLPVWNAAYAGPEKNTLAFIIGESTSRWNWQIYGYPRETTPQLAQESRDSLLFSDVISGANGTMASFRLMLTPQEIDTRLDDEAEPSVLMLAKAAGYKIWWISNQHDRYINSRFAAEADVFRLSNVGGGRGDRVLDDSVLPAWQEALDDPAPRKLIVVHLLGAHPHYELRSPPEFKKFSGAEDSVVEEMEASGRSEWVEMQRNSYDNAMLYQDMVIARLLHSFKTAMGAQPAAFLYTSDHAQEVGHTRDFAGHSLDESGCVVPLLIWQSAPPPAAASSLVQRPFQTDVLDWTLLSLMDIRTHFDRPDLVLMGDQFHIQTRSINGKPYIRSR